MTAEQREEAAKAAFAELASVMEKEKPRIDEDTGEQVFEQHHEPTVFVLDDDFDPYSLIGKAVGHRGSDDDSDSDDAGATMVERANVFGELRSVLAGRREETREA